MEPRRYPADFIDDNASIGTSQSIGKLSVGKRLGSNSFGPDLGPVGSKCNLYSGGEERSDDGDTTPNERYLASVNEAMSTMNKDNVGNNQLIRSVSERRRWFEATSAVVDEDSSNNDRSKPLKSFTEAVRIHDSLSAR